MRLITAIVAAAFVFGAAGPSIAQKTNESAAEQADKNKNTDTSAPMRQNSKDMKSDEQVPTTSTAPTAPRGNNH